MTNHDRPEKRPLADQPDAPTDASTDASADDQLEAEAQALDLWLPPEPADWSDIGEIEAKNWRDYEDIITNSLWIIGSRSRAGVHSGQYHGNFVPQIPYQAIRRFTKPGDVVLDTFLGSGTTLIEARRLGRHGIGIELVEARAEETRALVAQAENPHQTWQEVIRGDSTAAQTIEQVRRQLAAHGRDQVQLLVMHPPYHDIIKFSRQKEDLSNAQTVADFVAAFKKIVHLTYDLLAQNHFLVVVIGDKYSDKEWIPLGFQTMEAVQAVGYTLKSIVVKNMEGNRAKRNAQNLWRQRAFKGNWYIFKHEYVLFFQKTDQVVAPLDRVIDLVQQLDQREGLDLIQAKKSAFGSGEALKRYLDPAVNYTAISPPRILALKHGGRVRAVVLDLNGLQLRPAVERELDDFLNRLPETVIDVSALAADSQKERLQQLGISQVYRAEEQSLAQLAHALYVVRKAVEGGPRAAWPGGMALAAELNQVLAAQFAVGVDYVWRKRGRGVGFKFFKRRPEKDFAERQQGLPNFCLGLETKWLRVGEAETAAQLRDRYYQQGFPLIAVVGHNRVKWEAAIEAHGHFADYYLLLDKPDRQSLAEIVADRPLLRARGQAELEETNESLPAFLQRQSIALKNTA